MLLLGVLAGGLSDTSGGTASLKGGAASVVVSVGVTLVGMAVLVFALVLLWSFAKNPRGSSDSDGPVRTPFWRRMAFVLLIPGFAALFLYLHRHSRPRHVARFALPPASGLANSAHHSLVHFVPSASVATIGVIVAILAILASLAWLRARRRGKAWNLGEFLRSREDVTTDAASPLLLAQSFAGVHVPDPDEEADPRKAVVAAYLAMTHAAAGAGAERWTHETPAEFLQRLLASLGTSQEAARRLTFLFETARYSTRPFEETLRSDAITALRQIQRELRESTSGTAESGAAGSGAGGVGLA
jgi:hypothetical protein